VTGCCKHSNELVIYLRRNLLVKRVYSVHMLISTMQEKKRCVACKMVESVT
jgi:hypothetical protein